MVEEEEAAAAGTRLGGPYMHEGQSSDPQHPHKEMPMAMAAPVVPELRRQEKGSLSSLAC